MPYLCPVATSEIRVVGGVKRSAISPYTLTIWVRIPLNPRYRFSCEMCFWKRTKISKIEDEVGPLKEHKKPFEISFRLPQILEPLMKLYFSFYSPMTSWIEFRYCLQIWYLAASSSSRFVRLGFSKKMGLTFSVSRLGDFLVLRQLFTACCIDFQHKLPTYLGYFW